jgi:hypothetical protein
MSNTLTVTWTPRRKKRSRVQPRPPKPFTNRLTTTETRILAFYKSLTDSDDKFSRSIATIADELGVSPRTIRYANNHLKELGLLSWRSGHGNGSGRTCLANRYWLIPETLVKQIREATMSRIQ